MARNGQFKNFGPLPGAGRRGHGGGTGGTDTTKCGTCHQVQGRHTQACPNRST